MKLAIYTSNQPRHLRLIERLAAVADQVHVVMECTTLFPGQTEDFYRKSPHMQAYFQRVMAAEFSLFGGPRFLPAHVSVMPVRMGDLNAMALDAFAPSLDCDLHIVFGASYIKAPLIDALVERRAVNIHMGVSPYYRGSGCNFWAVHDGHPELVGATIHLLSRGLDSGPMLFHALPPREAVDPFHLGMLAVDESQRALVRAIEKGGLHQWQPVPQDKSLEMRYSRYSDFTDDVVSRYLGDVPSAAEIGALMAKAPLQPGLILVPTHPTAPAPPEPAVRG